MGKFSRFMVHGRSGRIASQCSFPSSMRKYSTRGGIPEKASRPTNPSFCSTTSVSVSVPGADTVEFLHEIAEPYTGRVPRDMDE
jgi:hypothetical protein